jgi:hypothetical protein
VCGDRVDDWREDHPRHPRVAGLVCRDRRRPEGQGSRAAGVQDRQDRLEGSCGAQPSSNRGCRSRTSSGTRRDRDAKACLAGVVGTGAPSARPHARTKSYDVTNNYA